MGKANSPQLERERAVYSYLDALEGGDIDGIIESLQRAIYDAPLDQMLMDAHQAYFQEEQVQQDALVEIETQTTLSMPIVPLRPHGEKGKQKPRRRTPVWLQTLAAVLVIGVLFGSFMALLAVHNATNSHKVTPPGAPGLPACYPLRQFDTQNNVTTAASFNILSAVATVSANDAWAVGSSYSSPNLGAQIYAPFIEHWDGKSWQVVPSPKSADGSGSLSAVAAVSANDVWAVGSSLQGTLAQGESSLAISRPLIEHWDGSSWQIMSNSGYGEQLNSLVAISQNDIWAVGSFAVGQTGHTFLEHWNGTDWQQFRWEQVSPDGSASGVSLTSMAAVSANDIWAVGVSRSVSGKQYTGLVMHWNGSQWQQEPTPPGSQNLFSVSAFSAQNVWIAGVDQNTHPLVEHWDGQQWSNAALPGSLANAWTNLRSIKAVSANDIWAVGSVEDPGQADARMLMLHWNGNSWQQLPVPTLQVPPSETLSASYANALAISDGQMWIVGSASVGDGKTLSLILGQHTCP